MILPSIDLRGGNAVQLVGGKELALDAGCPFAVAERFAVAGELSIVDLDAALGTGDNDAVIGELLRRYKCRVGGGIRSVERALRWLDAGAAQIVLGTAAVPELLRQLPRERVIAALDAVDGEVVVDGWRTRTGRGIAEVMAELRPFVAGFLVTFVEREGRLGGTAMARVGPLVQAADGARLTIAGGVTTAAEVAELDRLGVDAQVGMALYTGRLSLAEALWAPVRSDRPDGLVPTVIVDEHGVALGLAYSSKESFTAAIERGRGVYWSRSRGELWEKGATSGASQELLRIGVDCDRDALRFVVRQAEPGFCHLDTRTCWGEDAGLPRLDRTLRARAAQAPAGSYTARLFGDPELLASKIREEAEELIAAKEPSDVAHEAADVLYFALARARAAGVDLADIAAELDLRALRVRRRGGEAKPAVQSSASEWAAPFTVPVAGAAPKPAVDAVAGAPPVPPEAAVAGAAPQPAVDAVAGAPPAPPGAAVAGAAPQPSVDAVAGAPPVPPEAAVAGASPQPAVDAVAGAPPAPPEAAVAGEVLPRTAASGAPPTQRADAARDRATPLADPIAPLAPAVAPPVDGATPPRAGSSLRRILASDLPTLHREPVDAATLEAAAGLLAEVRDGGEQAVRRLALRFGDRAPDEPLILDRAELRRALDGLPAAARGVLERTADRIRAFAEQRRRDCLDTVLPIPGGSAEVRLTPVARAGCYAPGGRYPLPSSVLMTAITARAAGVAEVWVASPRPAPETLAAAALADADAVLAVGGVQAIGALAYGAGPIPACDAIVGPGNRWVTAAKQLVSGRVRIDMLAGPSELLVLADDSADPSLIAADLLAQAEHDPDARPMLCATSAALLDAVDAALADQLATLPTADVARRAVAEGFAVLVDDLDRAVDVANRLAPEHLALHVADPAPLRDRLTNYGAIFVGEGAAEVLGDYGAGPNHVLPTGGAARVAGALDVLTFLRPQGALILEPGPEARALASDAAALARLEGLEAHARAAEARLRPPHR